MKLAYLSIREIQNLFKEKKLSSEELVRYYLDRIKKLNKKLNAYLEVFEEEALKQAKESDKRRAAGKSLGILDGIPCAIKDNILLKDKKTTAGSKILENYIAPYDAFVIEKLKKSGVVFLGKTNLDEFAMGSSTENSAFGPSLNPWDLERVSGGSSGGSAVAVAADLCVFALGSDTGGSIRQPAAFCGVVGLKPTYGRVSRYGLIAMASSLDQIGPITKTVEDAAIVLEEISGIDKKDSTSREVKMPSVAFSDSFSLKKIKIGIVKEFFDSGIEEEVKTVIQKAVDFFQKNGAKIIEISLPLSRFALPCYYIIMPAEVSSNLARFDGIKYGYSAIKTHQSQIHDLFDVYLKSRGKGFGKEAKRRIMLGSYILSEGYYDQYYRKAVEVRKEIKKEYQKAFEKVDVLIGPTTPTLPFKLGEKSQDPLLMYLSDILTVPANLVGLPAISIPAGFSQNLPCGLQIIGKKWQEDLILSLAYFYEKHFYEKEKKWPTLSL